ncbi:hypothetical protein CYMTET_44353 [Cymbomonas tetramitiformis]|uniref:Uncharacterized protein n=1 Tax=Cymbomonas tetramitiformis TaxID=36881 RepID=A0AAE0C2I8_9CHLO|nr:hypothetical protein CYMTET_44353 [Cymbomonas tetramitiformis]|eukprot:gene149-270_t
MKSLTQTSEYENPLNAVDADMLLLKQQLVKSDSLFHEEYRFVCKLILHLFSELKYNPYHYDQNATTMYLKEIHDAFRLYIFVMNDPTKDNAESVAALKAVTKACEGLHKEMALQIEQCETSLVLCKKQTAECDAKLRECVKDRDVLDETSQTYLGTKRDARNTGWNQGRLSRGNGRHYCWLITRFIWDLLQLGGSMFVVRGQIKEAQATMEAASNVATSEKLSPNLPPNELKAQEEVKAYHEFLKKEENQKVIENWRVRQDERRKALKHAKQRDKNETVFFRSYVDYETTVQNQMDQAPKSAFASLEEEFAELREKMEENNLNIIAWDKETLEIKKWDGVKFLEETPDSPFSKWLQNITHPSTEEYTRWHMQQTRDYLPLIMGARMCEGVFSKAVSELSDPTTDTEYIAAHQKVLEVMKMGLVEGTREGLAREGMAMINNDRAMLEQKGELIYSILPAKFEELPPADKEKLTESAAGLFHNLATVPTMLYDILFSRIPDKSKLVSWFWEVRETPRLENIGVGRRPKSTTSSSKGNTSSPKRDAPSPKRDAPSPKRDAPSPKRDAPSPLRRSARLAEQQEKQQEKQQENQKKRGNSSKGGKHNNRKNKP